MSPNRQTAGAQGQIDQSLLGAIQPVFNQNLQRGADILRQGGPRFASAANQQIGDLTQRSLNEFNQFAAQLMQTQRGLDLQGLAQASQFALGNRGLDMNTMLPFLQMALQAGGAQSAAPIIQDPGFWGNVVSPIIGAAGSVLPFVGGGMPTQTQPTGGYPASANPTSYPGWMMPGWGMVR